MVQLRNEGHYMITDSFSSEDPTNFPYNSTTGEFDLTKSKELQRVGPVGLALRKSDTKHKSYNMDMLVEDNRLEKKNVNIYGSERESVRTVILRGFLNNKEFGPETGHALGLEKQIAEVLISAAAA